MINGCIVIQCMHDSRRMDLDPLSRDGLGDHKPRTQRPYWCGVGAARHGTSEDIETLQSKNNASTSGPGAVEECGASLARRASSRESYGHAIDDFIGWYCSEPRLAFNRTVVLRCRFFLEQKNLAPATVSVRLAAVRRLAYEAPKPTSEPE